MPDFALEEAARAAGRRVIAGVDEAGRGPLAGPVVAAAVVLPPEHIAFGELRTLDDSKTLSEARRTALFDQLASVAEIGVGFADVAEIDALNILGAALLAMQRAVAALRVAPDHCLVDGNKAPSLVCPAEAVIKGDGRSFSIAAASVVAKVTRDRIMTDLAGAFPDYGWARNKGYGTAEHLAALARFGATVHHRRSFRPVINILGEHRSPSPYVESSSPDKSLNPNNS